MPSYQYLAYDKAGKEKSGSLAVESEKQARKQLKEQGLFPTTIQIEKTASKKASEGGKLSLFNRVSNFDLALILRQLAILIKSGLPLEDSLALMAEQSDSDKQRRLIQGWRSDIIEGRSFSSSLKRSPFAVPEAVVAGVGVGEETGHLHGIMERMSDELEVGAENRQTFLRGLTYPAVLVVVCLIAMVVLMNFVVPQIARVFVSARAELPMITVIVVAISDFMQAYGAYIFAAMVLIGLGFYAWTRDQDRRRAWHSLMLRMPGVGRWMEMANISDWARSLGTLLGSGVPALSALKIATTVMSNLYLRQRMEAVNEQMRRGSSLHNALKTEQVGSGFLHHMVSSGEASSELDNMLIRVAEYYSARLKSAVETFLKLMNPTLIIVMGLMIVVIVIAVMLPILQLNELTG